MPNKTPAKNTPAADAGKSPAALIDQRIAELGDWRGQLLAKLRKAVLAADARIVEEWKWNTPVWSCDGIICTGETYKKVVKLTFAKGAQLKDPGKFFNSSLTGNTRRAVDVAEGAAVDLEALTAIVQAAVALNSKAGSGKPKRKSSSAS